MENLRFFTVASNSSQIVLLNNQSLFLIPITAGQEVNYNRYFGVIPKYYHSPKLMLDKDMIEELNLILNHLKMYCTPLTEDGQHIIWLYYNGVQYMHTYARTYL
jgi:hypothetical protein